MFAGKLEIGLNGALHLREEYLTFRKDACRVLYVSDVHLRAGRSDQLSQQVVESARRAAPDAILLGGDLVDNASELPKLGGMVAALCNVARVLAVGGNHDAKIGLERVQVSVESAGGEWIHDSITTINHHDRTILITGANAPGSANADVRVLCGHNPRIWKTSKHSGFDLVLAGHLHGCQLVAFEYRDRLFPGAAFYPYCFLSHQTESTRLVVSRGVSDLIPIRWRCPREVVMCYL